MLVPERPPITPPATPLDREAEMVHAVSDPPPGQAVPAETWVSMADPTASGGHDVTTTGVFDYHLDDQLAGRRLDYRVRITTPGRYRVWARMRYQVPDGHTGTPNSIHLGWGGEPVTLERGGWSFPSTMIDTWTWQAGDDQPLVITVDEPGEYRLHVWPREIGAHVDALVLSTNHDLDPATLARP